MRAPLKVEKLRSDDFPEMADWMSKLSHRNNIDTAIFNYPATETLKASNGKGLLYMPFQKTFMLESLAFNPEATNTEKALALREIMSVVTWEARNKGIGEIYFLCSDLETQTFVEHHGFEPMTPEAHKMPKAKGQVSEQAFADTMRLYRLKL